MNLGKCDSNGGQENTHPARSISDLHFTAHLLLNQWHWSTDSRRNRRYREHEGSTLSGFKAAFQKKKENSFCCFKVGRNKKGILLYKQPDLSTTRRPTNKSRYIFKNNGSISSLWYVRTVHLVFFWIDVESILYNKAGDSVVRKGIPAKTANLNLLK